MWTVATLLMGVACGGAEATPVAAVADAWSRPAEPGADAAVYFTLRNGRRDTLAVVGVASAAAGAASLHETMTMGRGAGAVAHMAPLARVVVPPGDSAVFAPNGRHVMLEALARPLRRGDRVPLVVRLASGDSLVADVEVRAP